MAKKAKKTKPKAAREFLRKDASRGARKAVAKKASPATKRARKAAKTAASEKVAKIRKPGPRAQDLPGMEDRGIKELDDIGVMYAEIRDARIALNKEEKSLKDTARRLMHKHDKTIYRHSGVDIRLEPGEEDVKVKVTEPKEEKQATSKGVDSGDARDAGPAATDAGDDNEAGASGDVDSIQDDDQA